MSYNDALYYLQTGGIRPDKTSLKLGSTSFSAKVEKKAALERGQLTTFKAVSDFVLGGKATFTVESVSTGTRFTFKVVEADSKLGLRFVKVLVGPDNSNDYAYLGFFSHGKYRHGGAKAKVGADAPAALAFAWFAAMLTSGVLSPKVRVWHEGRCAACARKLTVPASVYLGFGPDCAEALGLPWGDLPVCEAA